MSRKLYNLQIKLNALSEVDDVVGGGWLLSQHFQSAESDLPTRVADNFWVSGVNIS